MKKLLKKIKWFFTPFWVKRKIERRRRWNELYPSLGNLDYLEAMVRKYGDTDEIDWINSW